MLKQIVLVATISTTLLGAAALPAYAMLNAKDCAYAQKFLDAGEGGTTWNEWATTVQTCKLEHVK
jgi:hypothetical protein